MSAPRATWSAGHPAVSSFARAAVSSSAGTRVWSNAAAQVWSNRRALGTATSQTRAPSSGIVTTEGGGFIPTLELGGGAVFARSFSRVSGSGRS
jgi:hypothetical protein